MALTLSEAQKVIAADTGDADLIAKAEAVIAAVEEAVDAPESFEDLKVPEAP